MGDRRCCCGCWVFTDDFNRDDSTDLGEDWHEVVGDWGIQEIIDDMLTPHKYLVEKYDTSEGTAGAIVICARPVPFRSGGEMFIKINIPVDTLDNGDVYHIYPACLDIDTIGPVKVSFAWDSVLEEWTSSISYNEVATGESCTRHITGTPDYYTLNVCIDQEISMVKAWVSPTVNEYAAWADGLVIGTGRYAGLGHSNTGKLNLFEDFSLAELRIPNEICINCFCACENHALPMNLLAEIPVGSAFDRAYCMGGSKWAMNFYSTPQVTSWKGEITIYGERLEWVLTCGTGPTNFSLAWTNCGTGTHNCSTNIGGPTVCAQTPQPSSHYSTCDPLSLVFGPYTLNFNYLCDICYSKFQPPGCTGAPPIPTDCDGQFYIVITEAPSTMNALFEDGSDSFWENSTDRFWEV